VTVSLSALDTKALVLDIEGTTTPIEFVYQVLFPYARAHAAAYLERQSESPECHAAVDRLRAEQADDGARGLQPPESLAQYVFSLMDEDRKSPGLKALQGLVWQEGFTSGELQGQVYDDVPPALEQWRARGLPIYIYSSGSVLAQRLLFASTPAGDLRTYVSGYFDTGVGPKTSPDSYRSIAAQLSVDPATVLFVSDVVSELEAARASGMRTVLCLRDSQSGSCNAAGHPVIHTFRDITP
jgi:enolase-phosphatase E1